MVEQVIKELFPTYHNLAAYVEVVSMWLEHNSLTHNLNRFLDKILDEDLNTVQDTGLLRCGEIKTI
jgi:hypothetical protein